MNHHDKLIWQEYHIHDFVQLCYNWYMGIGNFINCVWEMKILIVTIFE